MMYLSCIDALTAFRTVPGQSVVYGIGMVNLVSRTSSSGSMVAWSHNLAFDLTCREKGRERLNFRPCYTATRRSECQSEYRQVRELLVTLECEDVAEALSYYKLSCILR